MSRCEAHVPTKLGLDPLLYFTLLHFNVSLSPQLERSSVRLLCHSFGSVGQLPRSQHTSLLTPFNPLFGPHLRETTRFKHWRETSRRKYTGVSCGAHRLRKLLDRYCSIKISQCITITPLKLQATILLHDENTLLLFLGDRFIGLIYATGT